MSGGIGGYAFDGLTILFVELGVELGICYCMTKTKQISDSKRLVPEVLCRLVLILAGALFYGTVTFRKLTSV